MGRFKGGRGSFLKGGGGGGGRESTNLEQGAPVATPTLDALLDRPNGLKCLH